MSSIIYLIDKYRLFDINATAYKAVALPNELCRQRPEL